MKVEQISVFLENKAGRLAEVTNTLATNEINIRALSLADTTDFGILRLIVDNSEKAKSVLKDKGFTVGKTNVVAVEVEDKPGGLNYILDTLGNNGINVEYMYAFVLPGSTNATLIFRFDKTDQAVEILSQNNIPIIPGTTLHS
ncbi:ACT domain-containing protein [Halodesulfovibrio sp.]|jgi:hypothetical protein|uniref:ACT domain-containing protein n=1 Tax=Halodesulfovibrio sp. TaxID=1912772 RepID=UPI0025CD5D21|nr:ACT domain-containing protein [Halodesulfovibrio sp.]MCT4534902.1 ACT domain-containing protein [Halodesulfovibrio sp.]MCT4627785.1 ACT domain-containing protein [Halodesulfovibrio sp.]